MIQRSKKTIDERFHPALDSKKVWNTQIAEIFSKYRLLQLLIFISMLLNLTAIGGVIHIGSQSKFIPYIVEVNKLGETVVVKRAEAGTVKDTRIIRARIAQFIRDLKVVTADVALQRGYVYNVYSSLRKGDPAMNKVNIYYNDKILNPFEIAKTSTKEIDIISLVANTESTYQIDWNEKIYDKAGILQSIESYRALVTIYLVDTAVDSVADLLENPLGIYVKDFNISDLKK